MSTLGYNIIVLAILAVLVTGAGIWLTFVEQPKEIEELVEAEKMARLREAEVTSLLAEEGTSSRIAEEAIAKWRARYKVIPQDLNSADVMNYINQRTRTGFKNFDVVIEGTRSNADFSTYSLRVTGRGYYSSLYKFIWEVENSRDFYRVSDLNLENIDLMTDDEETGNKKLEVMVSFSMRVEAYYGGQNGLSAPLGEEDLAAEDDLLPTSAANLDLPPVPADILPDSRPPINPFFPLILEQIPPNTYGLLNMEKATLIGIVGGKAILRDEAQDATLGVGDPVYLGEITSVNPAEGLVVARLNKGGIIDQIELRLETGDSFRQAVGSSRLAPAEPTN
jgi:hypothetical protein